MTVEAITVETAIVAAKATLTAAKTAMGAGDHGMNRPAWTRLSSLVGGGST
jgi:hypothetical protein